MVWDGVDTRNFVRANFPCKIIIHTPSEHILISHTENIGLGGVRVIIDESLDIASIVGLEVFLSGAQIVCKGRIVWVIEKSGSKKKEANIWDTGIEFYEIDQRDKKIVESFVNTVIADQK